MEITSLMIASEASTIKGRLYVTGGGYARHDVDHIPSPITLHVGAVIMAEPGEPVGDVVLAAWVLGPDGAAVPGERARLPVPLPEAASLPPEVPAVGGVAFELPFEAVAAGTHRLVVTAEEEAGAAVRRSLPFAVLVSPPREEDHRH